MVEHGAAPTHLTAEQCARLIDLLERDAVRDVVVRYARGADRLDEGLTRGAYWPDGYDNHGLFRGNAQEFVTWARELGAQSAGMQHLLGQSFIEIEGSKARCETYFLFTDSSSRQDPTDELKSLGGRYVDTLEKRDGIWKILHRDVAIDWSSSLHDVDRFPGVQEFTPGDHAPKDCSYRPL